MAYARITSQDAINTSATTSVSQSFPNATTIGNLLVATSFANGIGLGSLAISGWTQAVTASFLSAADVVSIFYKVSTGTETSVTATCTGASTMVLAIHEFSIGNLQLVQPWTDQTNTATVLTVATSLAFGSITPTKTNELVILMMGFPVGGTSGWSFNSGASLMSTNASMIDGFVVDQNVNAIAPTVTWTGLSTAGGCIASFFVGSQGDTRANHIIADSGMSTSEVAN